MTVLHRYKTLAGTARNEHGSEVMEKSLVTLMPPSNGSPSSVVFARIAVVLNWTYGSRRFSVTLDSSGNSPALVGFRVAGLDLLDPSLDLPSTPRSSRSIKGLSCIKDAQIKPEQYSAAIQFLVGTMYQKGSVQYLSDGLDEESRTISDTQGLNLGQPRLANLQNLDIRL